MTMPGMMEARKTTTEQSGEFLLSLIIPVFDEEYMIPRLLQEIDTALGKAPGYRIEIVFVNDGSSDHTLDLLVNAQTRDTRIRIVDLSRNFGKEAALTAGLDYARGDAVVLMDADLQDPLELIPKMIEQWRQGCEVVLGRRINRDTDSWAKKVTAQWYYRVHNQISDTPIPENVGDFRLMDRRVVDALREMPESRRFMKGILSWVGFRTGHVDYVRPPRAAGVTHFNGRRLWNFAIEGITSFSTIPLRLWLYLGAVSALVSLLFGLFVLLRTLVFGADVPGYASLMIAVIFFGSVQLIGIGIIGEYLARTYIESKRRPVYIARQIFEQSQDSADH